MLTAALLLAAGVMLTLAVGERPLRKLPLTPSVLYLCAGLAAGVALDVPGRWAVDQHAGWLVVVIELAVLVSLFAVGLRLRVAPTWRERWAEWRVALLMAGPGMLVAVLLGGALAMLVLGLPWPAAFLLAAVLSPTDPVLASEVQIRSDSDRDAVRFSLTAEGGLNDGTALPAVLLALAAMALGAPALVSGNVGEMAWALGWPVIGGALIGLATGTLLGHVLADRARRADPLLRDELLTMGAVTLSYGLALATRTSAFVLVFFLALMLLAPLTRAGLHGSEQALSKRMHSFSARIERLVEASAVTAVGVALSGIDASAPVLAFALAIVVVVRPLSTMAVVRRHAMAGLQRRMVAWFGIRGIGSLYYLVYALSQGVQGPVARSLIDATLAAIAASIVLHGVSVTPLMARYGRGGKRAG